MESKEALYLFLRYLFLLILTFENLLIIYVIFTPLSVYLSFFILFIIDNSTRLISSTQIFFRGEYIELIPACIAGAAYYLLLILNLSTPMEFKKRINSLFFLIIGFYLLNVMRIVVFSWLAVSGNSYFDITHMMFWYFGSTIMVVGLWFFNIWIFKIYEIPVYTDVKNILKDIVEKKTDKKETQKETLEVKYPSVPLPTEKKESLDQKHTKEIDQKKETQKEILQVPLPQKRKKRKIKKSQNTNKSEKKLSSRFS